MDMGSSCDGLSESDSCEETQNIQFIKDLRMRLTAGSGSVLENHPLAAKAAVILLLFRHE
jgi:hypothetical protein